MSAEEAARTPPPLVDDDVDAPYAPDVVLGDGRVVREVVVELEKLVTLMVKDMVAMV